LRVKRCEVREFDVKYRIFSLLAAVSILVRQGTAAQGKDEDISKKMFTLNPKPLPRERREGKGREER
jgi:hypothetical protein